jgi:hypothetical protein
MQYHMILEYAVVFRQSNKIVGGANCLTINVTEVPEIWSVK